MKSISVGSSSWTYTNSTLADNSYTFTAQVQQAANSAVFGQMSASAAVTIDATIPTQTLAISGIFDSNSIAVGGNNTTTTTPRISGTLSAALGAGEVLDLVRTGGAGTVTRQLTPTGSTNWTLTEPTALLTATTYTYRLQVRDAAGNVSVSQPSQTVTILAALPTISNIEVAYSAGLTAPRTNGTVVASGGSIADTTPTVQGTISAALPTGASVRIYRGGIAIRALTPVSTAWSFDDDDIGQGTRTYTARVENGTAYGSTSGGYTVTVDTVAPAAPLSITLRANDRPFENVSTTISGTVNISSGATTGEVDPQITVTFAALPAGERIRVFRNGSQVGGDHTVAGSTTYTVEDAPVLTRPSSAPTSTSGVAVSYTVKQVDAAGNESTVSAGTTFSVTINYLACNQTRALSLQVNATHSANWATTSAASCRGCHSAPVGTPTATGLIPAPGLGGASTPTSYYWCRKAE